MKTFESLVVVNSLMIIESLPNGETRTGNLLYEDLMHHANREKYHLAHVTAPGRSEFFAALGRLFSQARDGWRPILHLEVHGMPGIGLQLANGEIVGWDEFAAVCRELVEATDNNLVVLMAVCHGYEAITRVTLKEVTPFTALLGPLEEVTSGQIQQSTGDFYRELFATSDFNAASAKLVGGFRRYDCEQVFVSAFTKYVVDECSGPRRQERLDAALTQVRLAAPGCALGPLRKRAKELLKPSARDFERFRARFLLSDRAANTGRFTFNFQDALVAAEDARRARAKSAKELAKAKRMAK